MIIVTYNAAHITHEHCTIVSGSTTDVLTSLTIDFKRHYPVP